MEKNKMYEPNTNKFKLALLKRLEKVEKEVGISIANPIFAESFYQCVVLQLRVFS